MSSLLRISKRCLPHLRNIYKVDWPGHIVSHTAITHFIDRFEKKPEWEEKVKFWTLDENWKKNGTFAMVNENDQHILFNTLESSPYPTLRRTLELLDFEQEKVFVCFSDIFRPLVSDIIRIHDLEVTFDSGTKLLQFSRERLEEAARQTNHVPRINSVWAQRSSTSEKFLSTLIEENPSTGMFDSATGELAAWCLMLETGALGNLQVAEKYEGRDFGAIITAAQMMKVPKDRELFGHVVHQNSKSFNIHVKKKGHEWIGNNSWIGVKKKEPSIIVPLWGRL